MGVKEEKEKYPELRRVTLVFPIKDDQVLLAMKKKRFGEGKWNGMGGKLKPGEDTDMAIRREAKEEVGIDLTELSQVGILDFYFQENPEWNQQVIVYKSSRWEGEPSESEEMAPKWFEKSNMPYDQMWSGDRYWIPIVLDGGIVRASFLFDGNQQVIDMDVKKIEENKL